MLLTRSPIGSRNKWQRAQGHACRERLSKTQLFGWWSASQPSHNILFVQSSSRPSCSPQRCCHHLRFQIHRTLSIIVHKVVTYVAIKGLNVTRILFTPPQRLYRMDHSKMPWHPLKCVWPSCTYLSQLSHFFNSQPTTHTCLIQLQALKQFNAHQKQTFGLQQCSPVSFEPGRHALFAKMSSTPHAVLPLHTIRHQQHVVIGHRREHHNELWPETNDTKWTGLCESHISYIWQHGDRLW